MLCLATLQSEWQKDPEDKIRMIQEADARKQVKRAEATGLYKRVFIPIKNLVLPPEDDSIPDTSKIAVHDGFDDLYNRPIEQPGSGDVKLSPRQVSSNTTSLLSLCYVHCRIEDQYCAY